MLEKFLFGACKDFDENYQSDPEDTQKVDLMYSANSMKNFRYTLNQILKHKGHLYDIINLKRVSFK